MRPHLQRPAVLARLRRTVRTLVDYVPNDIGNHDAALLQRPKTVRVLVRPQQPCHMILAWLAWYCCELEDSPLSAARRLTSHALLYFLLPLLQRLLEQY